MIEYFQGSSGQIAFLIRENSENKIRDWFSSAEDEFNMFKKLSSDITSMSGGRALIFDFNLINDACIYLRIQWGAHYVNKLSEQVIGFSSAFQASQIYGIEEQVKNLPIEPNPYRRVSDDGKIIIFSICPDIYQHIAAWEHWNPEEAFTPRYSYSFQKMSNSVADSESIEVFDRLTKSFVMIIIDHEETYQTGEFIVYSTHSSEKPISQHIAVLNSYINRDYRMMEEYQQIRKFYPEYNRGIRVFFNELGIQSKYEDRIDE
jgi:hypothetical protein